MLEELFAWIWNEVSLLGYPAIFLLMLLEGLILVIPSEVVLPFIGFLVYEGQFSLIAAVIAATLGSLIGSIITYEVSRRQGRAFLRKYGRYVLLNEQHLEWSERLYTRYGERTIFFSRLLPIVRQLISVPAGTTGTPRARFIAYTFAGSFLWNFLLIYAGFLLGKEWHRVDQYTQPIDVFAVLIIAAFITWLVFKEVEKRTFLREVRPQLVKRGKQLRERGKELSEGIRDEFRKGLKRRLRRRRKKRI